MEIPSISVIIPLYNAKEYISNCLDSLLSQTFQDFEVIVVNDCSTDNSDEIVESYREKFGDRIKFIRTEKNSGNAGTPRNIGLNFANGEYVFFMDADDYLKENSLDTLYTAAKKHEAEVVYTSAYYNLNSPEEFRILRDAQAKKAQKDKVDNKAVLIIDEPDKNINGLSSGEDFRTAWTKFVQRDFLTKNEITFPAIPVGGDYIWSMNIGCHASKLLRLSVPVYFRRSYTSTLVARKVEKPAKKVSFWVPAFVSWLKAFGELASKNELLHKDSAQYFKISSDYFKYCLSWISDEMLNRFYSKDLYEILLYEFTKRKDLSALTIPFFFSTIANREKFITKSQKQFDKLMADNQKQINELTTEIAQQKEKNAALESNVCPLVSIIIPMYNAEKFIGELLESLLVQTLKNFEVLVVDDCSKDSSYKVVEKYIPKFGGRLRLLQMAQNSGAAPAPRNKGFLYSRGEYIFFMDADDAFTKTALEEMYTLAKDYDADVVYCEKYYMSTGIGQEFMNNTYLADSSIQTGEFVEKPTFISNNLADRLKDLAKRRFWVTPWQRLVKRELLAENNITFPEIIGSDDVVWCFQVLCCAKKFLRVPNICYIRRVYDESFTKSKKAPNKHIRQWSDIVIRGLRFAATFMNRLKFFQENPNHRYEALNILSKSAFGPIAPICANLKDEEIYDIFINEFAKDTGEHDALISFLCTRIIEEDKVFKKNQKEIKRLNENLKTTRNLNSEREKEVLRLKDEITRLKKEITRLENIKKLPDLPANSVNFSAPAISVVIPMYNAEEFIGECLDSLLLQTFQNFEVVIANDCSTDGSVKIVESYAQKFNGRLKFTSTEKNSGGGGYIPRNLGLSLASGEYVIFLDADDFLLGTALETLYNAAKEYDADVVYSSTYYNVVEPNDVYLYRDGLGRKMVKDNVEDKTELTVDDTDKIFSEFLASSEGNFRAPWSKFVRRDFLLKNEIRFPDIVTGGDCIWCINVYAYAKRFLRLPTPLYFYRRYNSTSITRTTRTPQEQLSYWVSAFIAFLKALNDLQNRTEVLKENPNYCYEATRGGHFEWCLNRTYEARKELSNQEVYEILYRELGKEKDLFETAVPFFFAVIDNEKKNREEKLQTIKTLRKEVEQFKKATKK